MPFLGSLYVVRGSKNEPSHIMRIDPPESSSSSSWHDTPPQMVVTCPAEQMTKPYLVECNSELLLVGFTLTKSRLLVLRLTDVLLGVPAMPLRSIGGYAIFIGTWSMTVNSKNLPSVQGNSIAVLNPFNGGQLAKYDLGRGAWSWLCDGNFSSACGSIPRPYSLVHHVVSCCQRLFWITGNIWHRHHSCNPCWPSVAGAHIRVCTRCAVWIKLLRRSGSYI